MSNFAERLQLAIKQAGLTPSKVATEIDLSAQAPQKWKKGQISLGTLIKIIELTGTDANWLLRGDKAPITTQQKLSVQMNSNTVTNGSSLHQNVGNYGFYDDGTKNDDNWFVVADHALSPTFCKNDHVLIDRTRKPQAGDYVLAEYDGKQIFRKYRPPRFDDNGTEYEQLVVYNDDYPILDSRFHTFAVLGVAVEYKRKLVQEI